MTLIGLFAGEERAAYFAFELEQNFSVSLESVQLKAIITGAILSLGVVVTGFILGSGSETIALLFFGSLIAPLLLVLFYYSYLLERRQKEKEKEASGLLLQASVFPRGTPVSQIIEFLGRKKNSFLGAEFAQAWSEIKSGAPVEKALGKIKERNRSRVIARMTDMLAIAYESGAFLGNSFRELAEELLEMQSMLAEKKAALAIERVTLIAGSALIVPFILGVLTGLVFGFDFSGIEIAGFSSTAQRQELLNTAPTANQLYIIEYAVIASVFLAWLDGNPRKAFVYAIVLIPVSTAVFVLSQGISAF